MLKEKVPDEAGRIWGAGANVLTVKTRSREANAGAPTDFSSGKQMESF